jgi:hypothetical protein
MHAHDLVTRKSITGILAMLNNMLLDGYTSVRRRWRHQPLAQNWWLQVSTELILEVRYMFHSLEVALDGPALMLGDNMSVVLDTTVSSSILKKNHNAIAYHREREAIAASMMRFASIKSE